MNIHVQQGWTDDRVAFLIKLWKDGLSCSQIANELGGMISRNAVIGKVHRLKLGRRRAEQFALRQRRYTQPRDIQPGPRRTSMKLNVHNVLFPVVELVDVPVSDDLDIPIEQRKALTDLTNRTCRWAVGDPCDPGFFFCGDPSADLAAGRPYCAGHARRAFNGRPVRKAA